MALAVVFGLVLLYNDQGIRRLQELRLEMERLEQDNATLREENRLLMQQIERIKTDPRYIEDEARKKLGLVRPDETIYKLADEDPPAEGGAQD